MLANAFLSMVGKTSIQVKESCSELEQRLRKTQNSQEKERLQLSS